MKVTWTHAARKASEAQQYITGWGPDLNLLEQVWHRPSNTWSYRVSSAKQPKPFVGPEYWFKRVV